MTLFKDTKDHELAIQMGRAKELAWNIPTEYPDLTGYKQIAVDLETCDPNLTTLGPGWARKDGYIVGIAVAAGDLEWYFPIRHANGHNLDPKITMRWLQKQMETPHIDKIMHNATYDLGWLRAEGVHVQGRIIDTMITGAVVDETRLSFSLNNLGRDYLNERKNEKLLRDAAAEWGLDPKAEMYKLPPEFVGRYAEQDAGMTLRLWNRLKLEIEGSDLWNIWHLETSLIPLMVDMRMLGVRVDVNSAEKAKTFFKRKSKELRSEIKRQTGVDIEPWAAASVARVFDHLGLPYPRTAVKKEEEQAQEPGQSRLDLNLPQGNPSFTKQWLTAHEHPIARMIVKLREYDKADSTFVDTILKHENNGRIHCEFHQLRSDDGGTVTGRFCVAADTLIETQRGPVPIVDVRPRTDFALSHLGRLQPIRHLIYKGEEEMVALRVSSGSVIKCTRNHRVLTASGWKRVGELTVGQEITGVVGDAGGASFPTCSVTVEEIEPLGIAQVWDIEVETDHSYVAHGLIHHNSSSSPNLQQIPARDPEIKKLIRGLFIPEEGTRWGSFDYSSQEPRLLVHFAASLGDDHKHSMVDGIVAEYHNGDVDLHQMVADMAGISRKEAKVVNLGIMYGMGKGKLAEQLGISTDDAGALLSKHEEKVPFVKALATLASTRAEKFGQIRTLLGRRCRFDLWEPRTFGYNKPLPLEEAQKTYGMVLRRAFTYKALNKLIQGSAADQTKKAMQDCYSEGLIPMLTVHDELCFSVESDDQARRIKEIMETGLSHVLKVPSKVDAELKDNWGEIE